MPHWENQASNTWTLWRIHSMSKKWQWIFGLMSQNWSNYIHGLCCTGTSEKIVYILWYIITIMILSLKLEVKKSFRDRWQNLTFCSIRYVCYFSWPDIFFCLQFKQLFTQRYFLKKAIYFQFWFFVWTKFSKIWPVLISQSYTKCCLDSINFKPLKNKC
jgi:hypothetical protein